ncbi:hypothetical protein M0R45_033630 [Rubus argutus]|uniref:Uncharacterized protein n=1 Tax=Rubus argutus TaxID=59490 RepID=A0AAW1WLQ0_RUBAR
MRWCGRRCVAMFEGFGIRITSSWEKEAKKINMFWELIRRKSTSLAPLMAEEKNKQEESFKYPSKDPNPRLQPSPVYNTSRHDPVLVEVGGKLYRFGGRCDCNSFEVFDQTHEKWLPLDVPPRKYPYGFTQAIVDTKILQWGRNQTGAYVFDVTHPEKGWTELNSCLGSYIPYVDGYHQLFVRLKFHHGEEEEEDNEDDDHDDYNDDGRGNNNDEGDGPDNIDKVRVLVIIFEYEIAKESMDIKYKLLSTRCPEYSTKNPEEEAQEIVTSSQLIGVHVL